MAVNWYSLPEDVQSLILDHLWTPRIASHSAFVFRLFPTARSLYAFFVWNNRWEALQTVTRERYKKDCSQSRSILAVCDMLPHILFYEKDRRHTVSFSYGYHIVYNSSINSKLIHGTYVKDEICTLLEAYFVTAARLPFSDAERRLRMNLLADTASFNQQLCKRGRRFCLSLKQEAHEWPLHPLWLSNTCTWPLLRSWASSLEKCASAPCLRRSTRAAVLLWIAQRSEETPI